MPGYLTQVGLTAMCPHAGQVSFSPGSPRVKLSGSPAGTVADLWTIAGCPFQLPPPTPSPCVTLQWLVTATRVTIGGQPAVLQDSQSLCKAPTQAPQGPASITVTQLRVKGQ